MSVSCTKYSTCTDMTYSKAQCSSTNDDEPRTDTTQGLDDTIHYMSPVSGSSLHGEDDIEFLPPAYLKYLQKSGAGFGEDISHFTGLTSESFDFLNLERTLCIIKPDAVDYEHVVIRRILKAGFKILSKKKIHLTPEQASELFVRFYGQIAFPYIVVNMSEGPIIVMCLAAVHAVEKWKDIVGCNGTLKHSWFWPKSMRTRFGCQESMENVLHASENIQVANREIRFFFPQMILEPLLNEEKVVTDFLQHYVIPTLLSGLTEMCKTKPIEPLLALGEWLLLNDPYQPKMKPEVAKLPT